MENSFDANYWDSRYRENQTGWDIGQASTPLRQYIDQLPNRNLAILVPGCGNGYEVEYLLQQGFTNITVIDIAPSLTCKLSEKLSRWNGKELTIVTGNFFDHSGTYDLILEQTFFCALDPHFRQQYVNKVHQLLKPGGKLAGVLFNREFPGGPPFGGSIREYEQLFSPLFPESTIEPCYNSIDARKNTEVFIRLVKPKVPAGSNNENFPGPRSVQ